MAFFLSGEDGYLPYALFAVSVARDILGCCFSLCIPVARVNRPQKTDLRQTSTMALIHTVFTYLTPLPAQKQFSGPLAPPPAPLTAHIYGVKNVYSGLIRLYAAYHIHNRELYTLALVTFAGVLGLYGAELLIWRTVRLRETSTSFIISGTMFCWMLMQMPWYVGTR